MHRGGVEYCRRGLPRWHRRTLLIFATFSWETSWRLQWHQVRRLHDCQDVNLDTDKFLQTKSVKSRCLHRRRQYIPKSVKMLTRTFWCLRRHYFWQFTKVWDQGNRRANHLMRFAVACFFISNHALLDMSNKHSQCLRQPHWVPVPYRIIESRNMRLLLSLCMSDFYLRNLVALIMLGPRTTFRLSTCL